MLLQKPHSAKTEWVFFVKLCRSKTGRNKKYPFGKTVKLSMDPVSEKAVA
jgi:hypothetical protein